MAEVAVVVLAAGASRRLGRPKQLLPYGHRTLLRHVVEQALAAAVGPVVVVLGAHAAQIGQALCGAPVSIALNRRWREGLASSIRSGVRAVARTFPHIPALVVVLGDQPLMSSHLLRQVVEAYGRVGARVVACRYQDGTVGPPALFARPLWRHLLSLRGDVGAKKVIMAHMDEALLLPFPKGTVDIDTEADWQAFLSGHPDPQGD
jgi:molybdenum cofactor cytidylyltransferase